jgi:hypothetical protein
MSRGDRRRRLTMLSNGNGDTIAEARKGELAKSCRFFPSSAQLPGFTLLTPGISRDLGRSTD